MQILEDHNKQLEAQLTRLRQLLEEPASKPSTLQTRSVTASQLNTECPMTKSGGSGGMPGIAAAGDNHYEHSEQISVFSS